MNPPPRRGGAFVVKVLSLSRDEPAAEGHPRRANRTGREFWGEDVRTCVARSSRHAQSVGWADWRARGVDGQTYPAAHEPLRTPAYPAHAVLEPGECVSGWWLITVPKGTPVDAIEFAPHDGPAVIEWKTMR